MNEIKPLAVSTSTAADMIDVSRPTLYRLLRTGEIPSFQLGSRRLIPTSGLAAWVEQQTKNGGSTENA